MNRQLPSFGTLAFKAALTHTVTYFLMGFLALTLFDYRNLYADESVRQLMRQVSEPIVMAGPLFQPLRGLLFAVAFYPVRDKFFGERRGWLISWLLLAILGIINTFGPSPGSVEGLIYTVLPGRFHLIGLPEVLLQSFLFSGLLYYWVNHPRKKWLTWLMVILFVLIVGLITLGIVMGNR
ncbi:hypothetical protein GCM10023189_46490 [Nibrella saemangeumensis]|uniref:Uncharacterized protein n=1 Tax=Nibrella saemangeumensis TaxID=1084526 RepID=A0ABP8NGS2_9BACT